MKALLAAAAAALILVASSPPTIIGDGAEYVAQALNFASLDGPSIPPRNFRAVASAVGAIDPWYARWDIRDSTVAGKDRRRDFTHFWFYALAATPGVWAMQAAGANPLFAFTILNLALLAVAFRAAWPRIGPAATVFLFAGPVVWWIDKAHTEVFSFSLLTVAVLLIRERPWWSMLAAGAAATQNPPMAAVLVLVFGSQLILNSSCRRDRRFWTGAGAGLLLAALHPLYYLVRHGRPSLLVEAGHIGVPPAATLMAVIVDPQIGLIGNFPAFLAVVIAAIVVVAIVQPRELAAADVVIAGVAGGVFLLAAAQTFNVHHGGTPSLTRYAIWLMPLAMPLLRRVHAAAGRRWRPVLTAVAVLSAAVCCAVFHPGVGQYAYTPTAVANWIWTRHPQWINPVPEIFSESLLPTDRTLAPVSTAGCEKILIAGRRTGTNVWPMPCYPASPPAVCDVPGAVCYANRTTPAYGFVRAAGTIPETDLRSEAAWPAGAEGTVRALFEEWRWDELRLSPAGPPAVREASRIERVWTWTGPGRSLIVIDRPADGARLLLRLAKPATGRLVDVVTGETVLRVGANQPASGDWAVPLPAAGGVFILLLSGG